MPRNDATASRRGRSLVWQHTDGLAIVFDPDSGQTHFLSELPALLLENIGASPRTIDQIAALIDAPAELHVDAREQIRRALALLKTKELVELTAVNLSANKGRES